MEEFFKTPTQEEIDRQWLTQLCYDGDMADDEIEEFVDAVIQWKNKAVECALSNVVGQSKQLVCPRCNGKNIDPTFYTDGYGCNDCGEYWAK